MGPCTAPRLGLGQGNADYLQLNSTYVCPSQDFNYIIGGSFAGLTTKFIQVAVLDCNQAILNAKYNGTKQCMPQSEMTRVSANVKLFIVLQDSYFKDDDF